MLLEMIPISNPGGLVDFDKLGNETHFRNIGHRQLRPETLMMRYGYRPDWSMGALKCPIFQTSTFMFDSAEEGKAFFEVAYGLRDKGPSEELGLIYSRLNNPNFEILEDRLTLWDGAESAALFDSGMAAIATTLLTFLRPGDVLVHSEPVYGGTDYLMNHVLTEFGIRSITFQAGTGPEEVERVVERGQALGRVAMIFVETPANPTNALVDIAHCAEIARSLGGESRPLVAVDNTFLGPLWQHPLH
jgi:methionine-gamma-lyase